jgi:hypothetical protein
VTEVVYWNALLSIQAFGAGHTFGQPLPETTLPNIGQPFFYLWTSAPAGASSEGLTLNVLGYAVPKGGE